jgi:murein L,D-transpeptidase YcbB/YkuD
MLKDYQNANTGKSDWAFIIPRKKDSIMALANQFATKQDGAFDDANQSYKLLKDELAKYLTIAKNGGWQPVVADKKLYKKGATSPAVISLRKRLAVTGELSASDSSNLYDTTLVMAIKTYQNSVGIKPDGSVSDALIKQLNVPLQKRIEQILINLDRMRWLPENQGSNYILANIPEFKIHVYDSSKEQFEMKTVVGKEGHSTVIFTGNLNQVVFAPYWNIPASIVKKEIIPGIKRNPNYLARHNMEVANGRYRQKPGGSNSLGHVKFLFPNDFDIYFHDTPAKSLFNRDNRAYSHGCIRLAEPAKMANYLLRNDTTWNPHRIDSAMNGKKEKTVFLKKPVPVLITYYTAWVNDGQLNFRNDIYGNDSLVAKKMFLNPIYH